MRSAKFEMRNAKFRNSKRTYLNYRKFAIRIPNVSFRISHFAFRISNFPLPSHPLGQGGYVSYVMPPVPRVERDVLFQTHDTYIGVYECAR